MTIIALSAIRVEVTTEDGKSGVLRAATSVLAAGFSSVLFLANKTHSDHVLETLAGAGISSDSISNITTKRIVRRGTLVEYTVCRVNLPALSQRVSLDDDCLDIRRDISRVDEGLHWVYDHLVDVMAEESVEAVGPSSYPELLSYTLENTGGNPDNATWLHPLLVGMGALLEQGFEITRPTQSRLVVWNPETGMGFTLEPSRAVHGVPPEGHARLREVQVSNFAKGLDDEYLEHFINASVLSGLPSSALSVKTIPYLPHSTHLVITLPDGGYYLILRSYSRDTSK